MQTKQPNIYQLARTGAGLSREKAAEVLDLSVSSVKAYETGETVPPNETVAIMARRYAASWLPIKHLEYSAAPLGIVPEVTVQELPTATLQLVNRMADFADRYRRLMQIAEDGTIDESEQVDFAEIAGELSDIIACALSVMYPGTKKERPEEATSKRSSSRTRTNCNSYYSRNLAFCNTFLQGVAAK